MSLNWPKPGIGHVPDYQVSSWPYVTASSIAASGDKKEFNSLELLDGFKFIMVITVEVQH